MQSVIDNVIELGRKEIPGVVALVTSPTDVLYEGAFGVRSCEDDALMTMDTIFALASMTKPLVSVAAMQLVERGSLELDVPIATYLPQLAAPSVLEGFAADGTPVVRAARGAVTARQLLSHSSGYGYSFWSEDLRRFQLQCGVGIVPANWDELERSPLLFDPGTKWAYGIGTDVLGKVIESVSGQVLDEFLDNNVLGPMGMRDTGVSLSAEQRTRAVSLHIRGADDARVVVHEPIDGGRNFCMGGGALCGTGLDYVRFLQMILRKGEVDGARILGSDSVAAMATCQTGDLAVLPMRTAMPDASNDVDLLPGTPLSWGLGFQLNNDRTSTGRSPGSMAWAGLFNTYFWIDPSAQIAGVLLAQVLPFADHRVLELFGSFEHAAYATV